MVNLHPAQPDAGQHQTDVRDHTEFLEGFSLPPARKHQQHHGQGRDLPDLDSQVERENSHEEAVKSERKLLETGGEPESVNQPEDKNQGQEVGRFHPEESLEPVYIVKTLVDNGQCNDGIHQIFVRRDAAERGEDQGDAVPDRERRYEFDDIDKLCQKKDLAVACVFLTMSFQI